MPMGSINTDSPSPRAQSGGRAPQGYNQLDSFWNALQKSNAQNVAGVNQQIGNFQGQLGQIAANQQYQSGLLNQGNNLGQQQIGLQQQGLGIQQGALNRQGPLLDQQYGLNNQLLDIQGNALQNAGQTAQYNFTRANQNLTGQTAAQGATNSQGYRRNQGDLAQQLSDSLANVNRGEQQLGINRQQQGLNYNENKASLADQQKNLDLTSKQLGLSLGDLENNTNQALAKLGLQTTLSTGDIYNSIINAQNGINDQLSPMIGTIVQYIMTQKVQ